MPPGKVVKVVVHVLGGIYRNVHSVVCGNLGASVRVGEAVMPIAEGLSDRLKALVRWLAAALTTS